MSNRWRLIKPQSLAIAYGLLATATVAISSFAEGSLLFERPVPTASIVVVQYPYAYNISTIIDFSLLNPIAIYLMAKAYMGYGAAFDHFGRQGDTSPFNKVGFAVLSGGIGVAAMWFYYSGFVGGQFFSAAFPPDQQGRATVSTTGWLIFAFTSIYLAAIVFSFFLFGRYILFVRSLKEEDFEFRLPPIRSRGIDTAISPCVFAIYVLVVLFVTLSIFVFRDFCQFGISESKRVWLLAPYLVACAFAFLPFLHLHHIMRAKKQRLIEEGNGAIESSILVERGSTKGPPPVREIDGTKLLTAVVDLEKLHQFYGSIPVWPTSSSTLALPQASVVISTLLLVMKFLYSLETLGHLLN